MSNDDDIVMMTRDFTCENTISEFLPFSVLMVSSLHCCQNDSFFYININNHNTVGHFSCLYCRGGFIYSCPPKQE